MSKIEYKVLGVFIIEIISLGGVEKHGFRITTQTPFPATFLHDVVNEN